MSRESKMAVPQHLIEGVIMATELWQRLLAARNGSGLRQIDIARAIGIRRAGYAFHEWVKPDGRTRPDVDQLKIISRKTGVPVEVLLDDNAEEADVWRLAVAHAAGEPALPQVKPTPPQAPAVNNDRARENFWRAVEFAVTSAAPELAACFAREVGPLGVTACFLHGARVVEFGDHRLRPHVCNLLMTEACVHRKLEKHLLVWGPDITPEMSMMDKELYTSFGVRLHQVEDGDAAARFLLSLR